ncbi:MAG: Fic family protein, partial [Flavobacteriales bacterium]|nr:Fic family protein [Flavobacteriales bacterium]
DPVPLLKKSTDMDISVDYFSFYKSISSVYSSRIEGEDIDFDSYYKHKFLNVDYRSEYIQRTNDLFEAYEFTEQRELVWTNVQQAHAILTRNLLPETLQGRIRTNPMFVVNNEDRIEYVAADASIIAAELEKLFADISALSSEKLSTVEVFYFASLIHLVFVKIHPFQDGNGRSARLLEKWFLMNQLGEMAVYVQSEKNYYRHIDEYYRNIRILGLEYDTLDYTNSLDFLLMTICGLNQV